MTGGSPTGTGAAPPTAAHVVVDDLAEPQLSGEDGHHLKSVLRLRPGEPVGATDGRGGYRRCAWGGGGRLEPVGEVVVTPARRPVLTVGLVPVKGDRPDWAVQKLTELGVDRIVIVASERAVVRWAGERLASHLVRLQRVARAAVMQSRQLWIPSIVAAASVADELGDPVSGVGRALADPGGHPLAPGIDTLLVGPEGGWSDAERAAAGSRRVGLGSSILRAETAAVAAGVLLTSVRAGLVGAVPAGPGPAGPGPAGPGPAGPGPDGPA
ncbi:MAG: 16S rRNA (uracil(1498)-N(3))-methyltransferase, partial [Acidobacteriota bacterium]|nr:16S rRNA (uracil(1498)-N(3))-methyltransferase [Acidobacteriota bacterium]